MTTSSGQVTNELTQQELEAMQSNVAAKIREAEKAAYDYFCACPVGVERVRASEVYENVRSSMRVG